MMYAGSPNSGIFKIPVANPGSAVDQASTTSASAFCALAKDAHSPASATARRRATTTRPASISPTSIRRSSRSTRRRRQSVSAIGRRSYKAFAHTLWSSPARRPHVRRDQGSGRETLIDDRNGNLVGNQGSTGTINYATGAMS